MAFTRRLTKRNQAPQPIHCNKRGIQPRKLKKPWKGCGQGHCLKMRRLHHLAKGFRRNCLHLQMGHPALSCRQFQRNSGKTRPGYCPSLLFLLQIQQGLAWPGQALLLFRGGKLLHSPSPLTPVKIWPSPRIWSSLYPMKMLTSCSTAC